MNNKALIEKWAQRYADRIRKEAEEERLKKEQEKREKAKNKDKKTEKDEKPIIETPEFKDAFFLWDEFGKQIHEKVQDKYGQFEAINKVIYNDKDKVVKGSTPFYVTAVNGIFREEFPQFRTATKADLEKILKDKNV